MFSDMNDMLVKFPTYLINHWRETKGKGYANFRDN